MEIEHELLHGVMRNTQRRAPPTHDVRLLEELTLAFLEVQRFMHGLQMQVKQQCNALPEHGAFIKQYLG